MTINSPDTSSVDRHIERIDKGRDALHDLGQCVIMYDDLKKEYEEVLRRLKSALDSRIGDFLLAKHDLLNPPALRVLPKQR